MRCPYGCYLVQAADEASGQPPASFLADAGSPALSMAMRVAAVVQGSQSGTLEELWRLFCTLQVCGGRLTHASFSEILQYHTLKPREAVWLRH